MDGGFTVTRERLRARVFEEAATRIQMLTGPRQVGKTTILLELARDFGDRAIYRAADIEEVASPGWWAIQWDRAVRLARTGPTLFIVDEIHALPRWARLVKVAFDEVARERLPLHLVISGSAALSLTSGARNELAGRFELLTLRHWSVQDLVQTFGLTDDDAAEVYVRFGAFPGELPRRTEYPRWREYILHAIVDPAINRDLLLLEQIQKPALLRQINRLASAHPGEIISLQKLAAQLLEKGAPATIAHYLDVLGEAFLLAAVQKFSTRELRLRASPPKLIPLSNAFLTAYADAAPPTAGADPIRWGRWLENACLAHAVNAGFQVSYWREEPHEVDLIVTGSCGQWAIEVKSGAYAARDLQGLMAFVERHRNFRPLVIGDDQYRGIAERIGIDFLRWQDYLLERWPA
jgi:predicted AAA+ superfamily ATPase